MLLTVVSPEVMTASGIGAGRFEDFSESSGES